MRHTQARWRPPSARRKLRRTIVIAVATTVVGSLLTAGAGSAAPTDVPQIVVLSNRADLVSGGDALVEVKLPDETDPTDVRVALDGRDITSQFAIRPNGGYQGLVTGLREGTNELTAYVTKNNGVKLTITNHSKQGPIFAGKQREPWVCGTEDAGLGPADSQDCTAHTRYDFYYKSTVTNKFEPYDPNNPPSGQLIEETTTDQGRNVPYIIRHERGVIDRGIYHIAVLSDPQSEWSPWKRQSGWNGKLFWVLESSGFPFNKQEGHGNFLGESETFVNDVPLSRGYAVVLTHLHRANQLMTAESVTMVKEHLIEQYGTVRYTVAFGGSGGSARSHGVANNYPGLFDALLTCCSIPDVWTVVVNDFVDFRLLYRYFYETSPQLWVDPTQRAAVDGTFAGIVGNEFNAISKLGSGAAFMDPQFYCTSRGTENGAAHEVGAEVEPDWVYDPSDNPSGVRCTYQDAQVSELGRREPETWGPIEKKIDKGFANSPYDNTGIQFGLTALLRGQISAEQFVDLNAKIGGRDIDYGWTQTRSKADLNGVENLYRSGEVNDGREMDKVAVIDINGGLNEEYHVNAHPAMTRARLIKSNGHADNWVHWETGEGTAGLLATDVFKKGFLTLDEWMTAVESDAGADPIESKIVRNKPALARNTCWLAGQPGACGDEMPKYSVPRMVAGGPVSSDIFKCQLKPIDWNDYGSVEFSPGQRKQLQETFPQGVCDWSTPGVGQQPMNGSWQSFIDKVGGEPLGPEPQSVPTKGGGIGRF